MEPTSGNGGAKNVTAPAQPGEPPVHDTQKAGDKTFEGREVSPVPEHSLDPALTRKKETDPSQNDLYFINDDTDRQKILNQCRKDHALTEPDSKPGRRVFYIDSPEALETQGLLNSVSYEKGQIRVSDGRLYGQQPLTVVLDLTNMRPGQIASMNDLLEFPHKCQGRPVGPNIRLVVLMDDMTGEQVGADCWRRLKRYRPKKIPPIEQAVLSNRALMDEQIQNPPPGQERSSDPAIKTVAFFGGDDWKTTLFGSFAVDERGRIAFNEGVLAGLKKGESLTLFDAPWSDPDFEATLASALREGGFEANNQWVKLPEGITLFRETTPPENIQQKMKQWSDELDADADFIRLNKTSCEFLQTSTHINEEGLLVSFNPLEEWLGKSEYMQIRVTHDLTAEQWRLFFHYYDQIPPDRRPALVFDDTDVDEPELRWVSTEDNLSTPEETDCFHYRFDAADQEDWDSLFSAISLSGKGHRFEQKRTGLLNALGQKKVILHGVKPGSALARKFQTLNEKPPYIFANGHRLQIKFNNNQGVTCCLEPKVKKVTTEEAEAIANKVAYEFLKIYGQSKKEIAINNPKFFLRVCTIYNMLFDLPECSNQGYPAQPLWSFEQLIRTAEKNFLSFELENLSYNRNLRYVVKFIGRPYQNNPAIYGFLQAQMQRLGLKVPVCHFFHGEISEKGIWYKWFPWLSGNQPCPPPLADRDALLDWLESNPLPDRESIKRDFWSLLRHCPVEKFENLPDTLTDPDESCIDLLAAYLCGAVRDSSEQDNLAKNLNIEEKTYYQKGHFYSGRLLKQLRDFHEMVSWESNFVSEPWLYRLIPVILEDKGFKDKDKIIDVQKTLEAISGQTPLRPGFKDFPQALVFGSRHAYLRQFTRLLKLKYITAVYPVVCLTGKSGTGKSWMAESLAESCDPGKSTILTIGAHTTQEDLFGQQVTRKTPEGDEYSEFQPGPILQWLDDSRSVVLILKQAHLAKKGVLAPLADHIGFRRRVSIFGETHNFNLFAPKRILLTDAGDDAGNKSGLDPALKNIAYRYYYRPIKPEVMALSVIRPALPGSWSEDLRGHACACIMSLFKQYQAILSEETLTFRDVKDVLANMNHSLQAAQSDIPPSVKQLNALVRDAFEQCLGSSLPENQKDKLVVLRHWSDKVFPEDPSILNGKKQAFAKFLGQLRQENKSIDLEATPFVNLVEHYWLCLSKGHQGRTAIIVEGPAGWGKDLVLNQVLALWHKPLPGQTQKNYIHINASLSQWDKLAETIRQAKIDGTTVAVSELNLIPAAYLEGLLNDVLSGRATPGFRLIATVNPASFAGRERISPALKSRCTQIKLAPMNRTDLQGVINRLANESVATWLTDRFLGLARVLHDRQLSLSPSMADLIDITARLKSQPQTQWPSIFEESFALEFRQAGLDLDDLEKLVQTRPASQPEEHPLVKAINQIEWLKHPVTVKISSEAGYDASERCLSLPDNLSANDPLDQVKQLLSQHKVVIPSHDFTALSGLPDYLLRPGQYPHMQEVDLAWSKQDQFFAPRKSRPRDSARPPVTQPVVSSLWNYFFGSPVSPDSEEAPGPLLKTSYIDGKVVADVNKVLPYHTRFAGSEYSPPDYRLGVYTLAVDQQHNLNYRLVKPDAEGIFQEKASKSWPTGGRIQVERGEVIGGQKMLLSEQWQPLPGLSSRDELRAIQVRDHPELEIKTARSKATGQLLVRLSKGRSQNVQLDFIIRPDQKYLNSPPEVSVSQRSLLSDAIRQRLERHVFDPGQDSPSFRELQAIQAETDHAKKVDALIKWCCSFRATEDIPKKGFDLLLGLIESKQGSCRHRSEIFLVLAGFFNISARMIKNDCHSYIEYSPDQGDSWCKVDLGGGSCIDRASSENILSASRWYSPAPLFQPVKQLATSLFQRIVRHEENPELQMKTAEKQLPASAETAQPKPEPKPEPKPLSARVPNFTQSPDQPAKTAAIEHWFKDWDTNPESISQPMEEDDLPLIWSSVINAIENETDPDPEDIGQLLDLLSNEDDGQKLQDLPENKVRWLRERMMSFFQSEAFIQALSKNPQFVDLIQHVLHLKKNVSENRQYLLRLFSVYCQKTSFNQGGLCDAVSSLLKIGENYLQEVDILGVLEAMQANPNDRNQANKRLNAFYTENFALSRTWPDSVRPPEPLPVASRVLNKRLGKPGLTTTWQKTPTGKMPSVLRLALGLSAFPRTTEGEGQARPAIVHLNGEVLRTLKLQYMDWLKGVKPSGSSQDDYFSAKDTFSGQSLPEPERQTEPEARNDASSGSSRDEYFSANDGEQSLPVSMEAQWSPSFEQVLNGFMQWLGSHDTRNNWCWLLSKGMEVSNSEEATFAAGNYKSPPPLQILKQLMQADPESVQLNPARIRKAVKQPEAVMLTSNDLQAAFREYLENQQATG